MVSCLQHEGVFYSRVPSRLFGRGLSDIACSALGSQTRPFGHGLSNIACSALGASPGSSGVGYRRSRLHRGESDPALRAWAIEYRVFSVGSRGRPFWDGLSNMALQRLGSLAHSPSGTVSVTLVPLLSVDSISILPPRSWIRSRILNSPRPSSMLWSDASTCIPFP